MKYLVKNGDIHSFYVGDFFYLFSRKFNAVFEINKEQFDYLNQEFNNFIMNEIIENSFNKNFKTIPINTEQRNLVINIDTRKKISFSLILKSVLDSYNSYNKLIINIELNYDSFYLIEEILKWINGYERIIILCRISKDEDDVNDNFKLYLKDFKKKYSIKIFEEIYHTIFLLENNNEILETSIKINPLLTSRKLDEIEVEQIISSLLNIKSSVSFKHSFESSLKLRPTDVMYISDNEFILTTEDNNSICNKCWAKNACFSNNFYNIFSLHPYICSLNKQNCKIILSIIDKTMKNSLNDRQNIFNDKFTNREITAEKYTLKHLNP
ncbi:MAG: hypothetical protein O9282_02980 [Flavobacterium sp.]|jgi:hypothetical protein|uniref:hypothetical protein n=1 Tax=Flavobacterium sp. TaxID=239 RepID=UPI0022BD995D|nr:hypothetical protein [Flavobacterium sp.]MCZ8330257.1 hypothetical protein [Flavobacterium sp.]